MSSPARALELVVSYSHRDEALKNELLVHLSPLRRQGVIRAWHDRDIDAGSDWKTEIDAQFNSADIIVLLVSPDFIHSDYCYEIEMTRALERHDAGECRVIPVFLRACDWKGVPFGRLQGLPDDAVPVVSNQWQSRDDAFVRVVQGIRKVAEKLRSVSPAPAAQAVPRQTQIASTLEPESPSAESIDDSGTAVFLDDKYFEADSVVETENDQFEIRIAPSTAEEDADLRALRGDNRFHGAVANFAHGNDAFAAQVRSARTETVAGRRVWRIELQRRDTNRHMYDVVSSGSKTAEEALLSRARQILLGEEPKRTRGIGAPDVQFFTSGGREEPLKGGVFPRIWNQASRDVVKFLRFGRLSAVFQLKMTGTCDDVLELRLGPVHNHQLHVRFRGRRKDHWSGQTINIELEGDCPLNRPSS